MVTWPYGKGPVVGQCPYCKSVVRIKWSCRIAKETYCTGCGHVNIQKVVFTVLAKDPTRALLDETWKSLKKKEVRIQPFLKTVNQLSRERYGVGIRKVSKSDLEKWGYMVSDEWVRKV